MKHKDRKSYDNHYQQLLKFLKLLGKADVTTDSYSREFQRVSEYFDCLPNNSLKMKTRDFTRVFS